MDKYIYIGNRAYVLRKMIEMNLHITHVLAMKNSYLERIVPELGIKYTVLDSKKHMLSILMNEDFDILVSNGCGYIIPVSSFSNKRFINIHPSYLPDLRGKDPIIAAIINARTAGATCHVMDDDIDNGDIIAQVEIPYSGDLDSPLLYQLSFIAEVQAFEKAHQLHFIPQKKQSFLPGMIYYSSKAEDRVLDFRKPVDEIFKTIRAFSNKSKGCFFKSAGSIYKVFRADVLENIFLQSYANNYPDLQLILVYEDSVIFKISGMPVKFSGITGDMHLLKPGAFIETAGTDEISN